MNIVLFFLYFLFIGISDGAFLKELFFGFFLIWLLIFLALFGIKKFRKNNFLILHIENDGMFYRSILCVFLLLDVYNLRWFFSEESRKQVDFFYFCLYFFVFLIIYFFLIKKKKFNKMFVLGIGLIFFLLKIVLILLSKNSLVDVFVFISNASALFSKGLNPYLFLKTSFPYFPLSFILGSFFHVFFGDVRFMIVFFQVIIFMILLRKNVQFSLIFLFLPYTFQVVSFSYFEDLIFLLFLLFYFFSQKSNTFFLTSFFLCLFFLSKQYVLLFLPIIFLYLKYKSKLREFWFGFFLSILIHFLFFLWSKDAYLKGVFMYQFKVVPTYTDLSFASFLYQMFGIKYNFYIFLMIFVFIYFYVLFHYVRRKNDFVFHLFLIIFSFFLFNRQAALNYYYFAGEIWFLYFFEKVDKNYLFNDRMFL